MTLTPPLSSHNQFACLALDDTPLSNDKRVPICSKVVQTPILTPTPPKLPTLKKWECRLPKKYVIATLSGKNSLAVDVELESTETSVKHCTQALIDCSAEGCCLDTEWVRANDIPTRPLTHPIPVFNVDGTPNLMGSIMHIADMILRYVGHSKWTSFAVTSLSRQSMLLGFDWLTKHNPKINRQTKEVKMSRCLEGCCTCQDERRRERIIARVATTQI